ncbi:MAG: secretin N-terminal domain-containing protein [Verrucomicrobiota bacterium]|nr:secretin N-terminal domain-containing protein [Verrucomicrobiota bacterium]
MILSSLTFSRFRHAVRLVLTASTLVLAGQAQSQAQETVPPPQPEAVPNFTTPVAAPGSAPVVPPTMPPNLHPPGPAPTLPPEVRARMMAQQQHGPGPQTSLPPPPMMTPPPPPSFVPPAPPPQSVQPQPTPANNSQQPATAMEGMAQAINQMRTATVADEGRDSNSPIPYEQSITLTPHPTPNMDEAVGLIKIPELGTNEIIEMLENFTGKPILRQQSLPAVKITFYSQGPMTRGEAILALESLLSLNGIAITPVGENFLKAIPTSIANTQVPALWEGTTLGAISSQKVYSKLFKLRFLTPTESLPLIQPLMSQGAPLLYEKAGLLLITDSLINLQRIESVLVKVDRRSPVPFKMLFFNLKNTASNDIVKRLQTLQQGPLKGQLENNTAFDADDRTNQLIIFTHPDNEEFINELVRKMDVDVDPLTRTEVYHVKHAQATDVASLIEEVVTGQKQSRPSKSSGSSSGGRAPAPQPVRPTPQPGQAGGSGESKSLQFSDYFTVVPDERANTIIASGTASDLAFLTGLIEKIDTLLPQVRIEAIITEVSLSNGITRGIDQFQYTYNRSTASLDGKVSADAKVGGQGHFLTPGLPGTTFLTPLAFGPGTTFSLDMVIQAAETNSNVQVLSAPTIVTTHNREASILVGEDRPFRTSSYQGTTTEANSSGLSSNYSYKKVGIELKVKPLIGSNGIIQMEIEQKVDNVKGTTADNVESPIIFTRQATSFVSVADGQVVVLGGLQSVDTNKAKSKMAFIGDIPLLGDLLSRRVRSESRSELLIFIRPTIMNSAEETNTEAMRLIKMQESRAKIEEYLKNGKFKEPAPEKGKEPPPLQRKNLP